MAYTGFEHDLNVWVARQDCEFPLLDVTLTWSDSDTTKEYLFQTWTNGETKAICPLYYGCNYSKTSDIVDPYDTTYNLNINEYWSIGTSESVPSSITQYRYTRHTQSGTITNTNSIFDSWTLRNKLNFYTGKEIHQVYNKGTITYSYTYTTSPVTFQYTNYNRTNRTSQGFNVGRRYSDTFGYQADWNNEQYISSYGNGKYTNGKRRYFYLKKDYTSIYPMITTIKSNTIPSLKNSPQLSGTITSNSGITISWEPNTTGKEWGSCYPD